MKKEQLIGKYILWVNYGYEGWQPSNFHSLKEAIEFEKYGSDWVITSGQIDYEISEKSSPPNLTD